MLLGIRSLIAWLLSLPSLLILPLQELLFEVDSIDSDLVSSLDLSRNSVHEVFADMEELRIKPDEDTVSRVARAFRELGQEE